MAIKTKLFNKIFKNNICDLGIRITNLVVLPFEQAVGTIYQGLYYDSTEFTDIKPRYIFISKETLEKNWISIESSN
jgi:hypothetical protein